MVNLKEGAHGEDRSSTKEETANRVNLRLQLSDRGKRL